MLTRSELLRTAASLWRHPAARREQLLAFQDAKLRSLVRFAHARVPYYRELLDGAGVEPESIRCLADLAAIPLTTKEALRARGPGGILAGGVDPRRLLLRRTSGSTGQPFAIRRTPREDRLLYLFRMRARLQHGLRPFDRRVAATELPIDGEHRTPWSRLGRGLGILRVDRVDGLAAPAEVAAALERIAPDVLGGYPSTLADVARVITERGRGRLRPRFLTAGGETLEPAVRRRIEAAFGAPLFLSYGAHEFNLIAWQCPSGPGLHVCEDSVVVEILRDGRPAPPGEWGDVVVTGLHGRAMPFLRYAIGDVARWAAHPCPCGQPFALLEDIRGRSLEFLRLPGGDRVHPYRITGPLIDREGDWIHRHQLTQESETRVVLRVVPCRPPEPDALDRLDALGARALGPGVSFSVEIVDSIAQGPGGKFQPYRSLLAECAEAAP